MTVIGFSLPRELLENLFIDPFLLWGTSDDRRPIFTFLCLAIIMGREELEGKTTLEIQSHVKLQKADLQ